MLNNIDSSFLKQQMNKIACAFQNTKGQNLACKYLHFWSLLTPVAVDTAVDLTLGGSGGSTFHSLCHIHRYINLFFVAVNTELTLFLIHNDWTTAKFGQLGYSASFVSLGPHLKSV